MKKAIPDLTRFFHPVLPARLLGKTPVRVELGERRYVLFRDGNGRAAALNDACPHRKAALSQGFVRSDGTLACPYHGWNFDALGHGRSPAQPTLAHCDTVAYQVVENYGYLWLAAIETPIDALPQLGWDGFEFAGSFSTLFKAPLHVVLDNFSEDEHFSSVHSSLGWDESGLAQVDFKAEVKSDHTCVHYQGPQRPSPWLLFFGVKAGDYFNNDWVTRFDPVQAVFTMYWVDATNGLPRPFVIRSAAFIMPETSKNTRIHTFVFFKIASGSLLRRFIPIIRPVILLLGRYEVAADARFIVNVADTPSDLKQMRLGKFDLPIIHNRRLLQSIYFGKQVETTSLLSNGVPVGSQVLPSNDLE
ncbi:Rieske 2Fe-2S domain-containing protein [Nostoc sp. FACHB-888]|uniref:Rieske 2Fe-2S domain-containing protein n=1 Tax=Nostoc sp. FACHB-888 TaxID=2692842 RepID=UPI001683A554|nr:Rieske 2Fe-2S domain-containing protein [Nostoc sp. FACHB-888]MBD2248699.1 Rieske 2Fe-2S domain-containing protein [Nostoc sp. FACHB-888]